MVQLKPGHRLFSAVCDAEFMVVRGAGDSNLSCGGCELSDAAVEAKSEMQEGQSAGVLIGKRYVDTSGDVELLCTRAGQGTLSIDGDQMLVKEAQSLPSSD